MKIAICQINTTVADFRGNQKKILEGMAWAKARGAKLALFPEFCIFGYPPRDLLDKSYLVEKNIALAHQIAQKTTKDFGVVFGYVGKNSLPSGRGLYNSACLAYAGKIQHEQPKTLLPTYDVFDEARHFDIATQHRPHRFQNVSLGLTVCEDIWFDFDFEGRRYYTVNPTSLLKGAGAELIINISASPFVVGKQDQRRKLLASVARENHLPIFYCNLVGGNDELVFDGRSLVFNADGAIIFEGKPFEEDRAIIDLDDSAPLKKNLKVEDVEEVYEALILGLKDYFQKCGFKKALIGLSGGIDSSVVAVFAVKALGAKNVLGISMPSPYSSKGSIQDAKDLAKNLGILFRIISISDIYQNYIKTLNIDLRKKIPLAAENIQARIRGNILMAFSNQTGALVLSTGNKSELACGYCTIYGDMAGGMALLSDVPKTMVFQLARFMNRKKNCIPPSVIRKPPSAELRPNQKDQDSLPPYDILDAILKLYIEEHHSESEIIKKGFSKKIVESVISKVDHNEYKRRQAPPGIKVTSKAFGMGRRFPIAWAYKK